MTNEAENNPIQDVNDIKDEKKLKYKSKRVILSTIIALSAIIGGINYYNHSMSYVTTDDAFIEGNSVPISPKVSGNILKVYVDDNQQVKKGQLLAVIDPQDYQVKYEQAIARLQAAEEKQKSAAVNVNFTSATSESAAEQANSGVGIAQAGLDIADKQIAQTKANLAQVNQDIESLKAESALALIDYTRYQELYKKGVVSKQDFDRASTSYKTYSAKLKAGQERATAAQSSLMSAYANKQSASKSLNLAFAKFKGANTVTQQVSMSDSARKISLAEIRQLQAAAKQAKLDLLYTNIYAPQSGSVIGKGLEVGALVQIGQPVLVIVPEKRWVIANFKETQLTNMNIGQSVNIKVDAYPNKIFKGRIDSIQSSTGAKSSLFPPENAVGSFVKVVQRVPVKITFTDKIDAKFAIVPGMSVIPEVKVK